MLGAAGYYIHGVRRSHKLEESNQTYGVKELSADNYINAAFLRRRLHDHKHYCICVLHIILMHAYF